MRYFSQFFFVAILLMRECCLCLEYSEGMWCINRLEAYKMASGILCVSMPNSRCRVVEGVFLENSLDSFI